MDTPPNDPNSANENSEPRPGNEGLGGAEGSGGSIPPSMAPPSESEQSSNLPPNAGGDFGQQNPTGAVPPAGYAYYPRYYPQNKGPVPPAPAVVRFAAIGEAWQLIREDFANFAVGFLVVLIFGWMLGAIVQIPVQSVLMSAMPRPQPGSTNVWDYIPHTPQFWLTYAAVATVAQSLGSILTAGMYSMCLKRVRGEPYTIANVFDGFKFIVPLAITGLITFVFAAIGVFLLFVPYLFVAGALAFVPLIVIDQKAKPFEAIALSFSSIRKNASLTSIVEVLAMGVLVFVAGLVSGLGFCACCIGVVFTGPILFMTIALHYHAYFPPQGGPEVAPVMPMPVPQYSV